MDHVCNLAKTGFTTFKKSTLSNVVSSLRLSNTIKTLSDKSGKEQWIKWDAICFILPYQSIQIQSHLSYQQNLQLFYVSRARRFFYKTYRSTVDQDFQSFKKLNGESVCPGRWWSPVDWVKQVFCSYSHFKISCIWILSTTEWFAEILPQLILNK